MQIIQEDYQYSDNNGDGGFASQKDYEESRDNGEDTMNEIFLKNFYLGKDQKPYCLRCQGVCREVQHGN